MKLNVPILGQRDSRWASQRLGTVDGTTIGGEGCLITCCCMVALYYGKDMTPDKFDNWLTDNGGYVQGNLYNSDALTWYYGDIKHDSTVMCQSTPAPLDRIDESLKNGFPVIIGVNFNQTGNDPTHFVVIVGRMDDGTYIINDPWFQDQVFLTARYGKDQVQSILECIFYSGPQVHFVDVAPVAPTPVVTTPNPTIQVLSDPTPIPAPTSSANSAQVPPENTVQTATQPAIPVPTPPVGSVNVVTDQPVVTIPTVTTSPTLPIDPIVVSTSPVMPPTAWPNKQSDLIAPSLWERFLNWLGSIFNKP